tara:strand:- start:1146 stop:1328 length:183 start_codon:yes stop_codon:yes gene_type:complete
MNTELNNLREEIQGTLEVEKKNLEAYDPMFNDPDMHNCKGWCEALQYVLRQINNIEEATR